MKDIDAKRGREKSSVETPVKKQNRRRGNNGRAVEGARWSLEEGSGEKMGREEGESESVAVRGKGAIATGGGELLAHR